jgi:hypothetical protein
MLVTFSTSVYADITMFGDVAVQLLRMMGHSGTVPGALLADEVQPALERLEAAIEAEKRTREAEGAASEDEEGEPVVPLSHRALPLIELLRAAAREDANVMWDKKG